MGSVSRKYQAFSEPLFLDSCADAITSTDSQQDGAVEAGVLPVCSLSHPCYLPQMVLTPPS